VLSPLNTTKPPIYPLYTIGANFKFSHTNLFPFYISPNYQTNQVIVSWLTKQTKRKELKKEEWSRDKIYPIHLEHSHLVSCYSDENICKNLHTGKTPSSHHAQESK